jgi:hypothetical protein
MDILPELNSRETFEGNSFSAFEVGMEILCITMKKEQL